MINDIAKELKEHTPFIVFGIFVMVFF